MSITIKTQTTLFSSENTIIKKIIDGESGNAYIIKQPQPKTMSSEKLGRLQHEYTVNTILAKIKTTYAAVDFVYLDQIPTIVFPNLSGQNIGEILAQKGRFSVSEFLDAAILIVRSLAKIHSANIIHKDINKHNIIYNMQEKRVEIIDFGISSLLQSEKIEQNQLTEIEGTLPYISPEQTTRMNCPVDYRTDYYSLGATFYEMITGHPPFQANDILGYVHAHMAQTPKKPSQQVACPAPIEAIILKLLEKSPDNRYQSSFGLLSDLEECHKQLNESGTITLDKIATRDRNERFTIPNKFYGREDELIQLMHIFNSAISSGNNELTLISGYSGIGKTSLIHEVYKPLIAAKGIFAKGKFDQIQRNSSSIICQILDSIFNEYTNAHQELFNEAIKNINSLSPDCLCYVGALSEPWRKLAAENIDLSQKKPEEIEHNTIAAIKTVFRQLCCRDCPMVVFFDDLQWSDELTLKIIDALTTDDQLAYFLAIGAYRNNEVAKSHLLNIKISDIRERRTVHELNLQPLHQDDVTNLIADTFTQNRDYVANVSSIIFSKTGGNPFFLKQALNKMVADGAIKFDYDKGRWVWNNDDLLKYQTSQNIVEETLGRLRDIDKAEKEILFFASCLGSTFDLYTLSIVTKSEQLKINEYLKSAMNNSIIVPHSQEYKYLASNNTPYRNILFSFAHDQIQNMVYNLVNEETRKNHHLQIARELQRTGTKNRTAIVINYDKCLDLLKNEEEKMQVAIDNFHESVEAKEMTSYRAAYQYSKNAINLSSERIWSTNEELAIPIWRNHIEVCFLAEEFDELKVTFDEALKRISMPYHRADFYFLRALQAQGQEGSLSALQLGISALKELGYNFSLNTIPPNVIWAFVRCQIAIRRKNTDELYHAKQITDKSLLLTLQIMSKLVSIAAPASYELLAARLIFTSTYLCIKNGNSRYSSYIYMLFGAVGLVGQMGNYKLGSTFIKLSMRLVKDLEDCAEKAKTLHLYCLFGISFQEGWARVRDYCKDSVRISVLFQEYETTLYGCNMIYLADQTLSYPEKLKIADDYYQIAKNIEFEKSSSFNVLIRKLINNMINESAHPEAIFETSDAETNYIARQRESKNAFMEIILSYLKVRLALYFSPLENLFSIADKMMSIQHMYRQTLYDLHCRTAVVIAFGEAAAAGIITKRDGINRLQKLLKNTISRASFQPDNYTHIRHLCVAEIMLVEGKYFEAEKSYNEALASGIKGNYFEFTANVYDRLSKLNRLLSKLDVADFYDSKAIEVYRKIGATAVIKHREKLGNKDITNGSTTTMITRTQQTQSQGINFLSIVKSTQAISSATRSADLVKILLDIAIENAGAQRGVFISIEDENGRQKLSIKMDTNAAENKNDGEFDRRTDLPVRWLPRVAKKAIAAILENATESAQHEDPYFARSKIKSVLAIPIKNQGRIIGLIYLENNLATGVFTANHLETLEIIARQAAISIENAYLYEHLEAKVAQRTAELSEKNKEIETILNNMEQGVFMFEEDCTILPVYSSHLRTIFGEENLAGKSIFDLLFKRTTINENDLSLVKSALNMCIDSEDYAYDMNCHVLPKEVNYTFGNEKRVLEIIWQPILNELNCVSRMVVIIRDITELLRLRSESDLKNMQMAIIEQVLNISFPKFRRFVVSAKDYIQKCRVILKAKAITADDMNTLFRMIHTIKGNARNDALSFIVNNAHVLEQHIEELRKADKGSDTSLDVLRSELEGLDKNITMYTDVLKEKGLASMFDHMADDTHISWQDFVVEVCKPLPRLAAAVNKEVPKVEAPSLALNIHQKAQAALLDMLNHCLANSLDHGIESPEERIAKGKNPAGTVKLGVTKEGDIYEFTISDDGRGLNLKRLREKLMEQGETNLSDQIVAESIFRSGISTAKEVSHISGRGVGMDAVKSFSREKGGDVLIKLDGSSPANADFCSFKLVILLPKTFIESGEEL